VRPDAGRPISASLLQSPILLRAPAAGL